MSKDVWTRQGCWSRSRSTPATLLALAVSLAAALARVVLPTSQVFLDPLDGFDTRAFDVRRQKTIYDYVRADVRGTDTVPGPLARFFVRQVQRYAGEADATQRALRVLRGRWMAGEARGPIEAERRAVAVRLRSQGAPAPDQSAVDSFAEELDGR